jgi:hypothetical protein
MREIVNQVVDTLQQTYETRSSIQNTVCIVCIFKPASWLKLWDVIGLIDQSIIETSRNLEMYQTIESRSEIELLTAIQQSFGVIVPKLSQLIDLGTTLSQKIEQENLSEEQARETEEFISIAGIKGSNGVYTEGLIDHVKDYISQWLKDHGKKPYVGSHFQPLFAFWEEHESNLLRFKTWPTISLVDPDPKPLLIKHQRKILSPDELTSSEEIFSIISNQAGSDLIGKLHFLSVFVIGPKNGALDLIDTVFPNRPTHWYESMLGLGQAYSSSTSRGSSKSNSARLSSPKSGPFPRSASVATISTSNSGRSRSGLGGGMVSPSPSRSQHISGTPAKTFFYIREKRINTANQRKMADLVQSAVWKFNAEQVSGLPLHRPTPASTAASRHPTSTTSPRHPTSTLASSSSGPSQSLAHSSATPSRPRAHRTIRARPTTSSTTPTRSTTPSITPTRPTTPAISTHS